MRTNKIKKMLANGEVALGGNINFYSPELVELMGALGLDWAFIDCEHGLMDETEVVNMVRAAELYDMVPILRVPTNSAHVILRYMDLGVMGILIPHLDTREDAEKAVESAKYYPMGARGSNYGGGRNNSYGVGMKDVREYYEASNRETMVLALIESEQAVRNIEDILSVPGIDASWLGPADLAQSMGFPDQSVVDEAVESVIEATAKAGKISAVAHLPHDATEIMDRYYSKGSRMLSVSVLPFVAQGIAGWAARLRQLAGDERA